MTNREPRAAVKSYLVSCGCAAAIPVGPGQAGGQVACPRCGQAVGVPRLGELSRLPAIDSQAAVPRGFWTAAHGFLLGGCLVALLSGASAAYLGTAPRPLVDAATIRAAVAAASVTDIYKAWQALARSGVSRPPMADEERIAQLARSARAVATVLWVVAVIGAATAVGGGIAVARARKQGT